ncbi:ribosome biogenesis/translation initiation ATPase RLI [Candidatus Woesearchaeota archaeon]|nr:ribosome biogenesis/translation initiation ATPase RLI [Candidatus Woesearchaeota archaeon]
MNKFTAIVDKDKCAPNKCQLECIKFDPLNRVKDGEGFHIGQDKKAVISEKVVTEMHKIPAKKCPFEAIKIIKLPSELKQEPVHQYGQNEFRLFTLPVPKKETVVGVIGRNGIGKTTALAILSGSLNANLGDYNNEKNLDIVEIYSNSILGGYFEKLREHKIKVSYKPQRIELLPEVYKGRKVKELIEKSDELRISKELISKLDMKSILDRNVEELSGGELQKLAIVACLIKNAQVYYLDEPMSFLDITTRINVARLIRELKKSIIVVEHDLTSLDYISDEVQIVYGERGAYGIFSQSKGVRNGVNEYLDGYIKSDNVKFRDYAIRFNESPVTKTKTDVMLFEFPEMEKKFESFELKVESGKVNKGEVIGVVGANGLGKSTFLKLITGQEKADKGKVDKVKFSYKPQYIKAEKGNVLDYLKEKAGNSFNSGWYKQNILEKLGVGNILMSEMKNLSGGELQKVMVAGCLSEDVELVLMDEPSAFVDVEDRLNMAEIIKDFIIRKEICAIIVDHDIQFVDYLSDSLLVFEGKSGINGRMEGINEKREGMNKVLKMLDITYRVDKTTGRRRINKPRSQLDQQQRKKGEFYYR